MSQEISIRQYKPEDVSFLAAIYYNTVHFINIQHYTQEQVDVWAPLESLKIEGWAKKFLKTNPIVAVIGKQIVGFAECTLDGHIDCFYCHHDWIGKGVGSKLLSSIFEKAREFSVTHLFTEVSITAKPFFQKHGFTVLFEETVVRSGISLIRYKMERYL